MSLSLLESGVQDLGGQPWGVSARFGGVSQEVRGPHCEGSAQGGGVQPRVPLLCRFFPNLSPVLYSNVSSPCVPFQIRSRPCRMNGTMNNVAVSWLFSSFEEQDGKRGLSSSNFQSERLAGCFFSGTTKTCFCSSFCSIPAHEFPVLQRTCLSTTVFASKPAHSLCRVFVSAMRTYISLSRLTHNVKPANFITSPSNLPSVLGCPLLPSLCRVI